MGGSMCKRAPTSASIDSAARHVRVAADGRLAQLVARFLHTEEVVGSSPASPTNAPTPLGAFFISPNCLTHATREPVAACARPA
jgi:hypothetical protein